MNWGNSIVLVFILFAGIIITMVTVSMRQKVDLVAEDYYQQEIQYQQQIDRMENSQKLKALPQFTYEGGQQIGKVRFPSKLKATNIEGSIYFFRPSDASMDREFILDLDDHGVQTIPLDALPKGLWKVKIQWQQEGKEYYKEQTLTI